ncbi:MAG: polysaccharide deacetylase family protein [Clostridia bacterium]|nr:polysaccharide deacetylase family protein [Clostridia bacterium]
MTLIVKFKSLIACVLTAVAITALSLGAYFSGAYAVWYGNTPRLLPIYSVERDDKLISISFDCAWGTDYTDQILNNLRVGEVKATWFMVEFWSEKYPEYVKKIDEAGHEIGTHSATHSYMSKQNAEEIRLELKTSSEAIKNVTGKDVELFRPPYGDYNDRLVKTASEEGYYCIQWDVDSLDWRDLSATDIAMRVISGVKSGSIILMHNNGLHTAEAVPIIVETLKNKGYKFVPIGELIYRENYTMDVTGRQKPAT